MKLKTYLFVTTFLTTALLQFSCKKDSQRPASADIRNESGNTLLNVFSEPLYVTLYAGTGNLNVKNGPRLTAEFNELHGIAASVSGSLYIGDQTTGIRKISPDGIVSSLTFKKAFTAFSLTRGNDGVIYFVENTNPETQNRIRSIDVNDQIQPAYETCNCEVVDGVKQPYQFTLLYDLAVAADGTMYITDAGNNTIVKRTPKGVGSLFAGGTTGLNDGKGASAQFKQVTDIAIDSLNNLYVVDYNRIRKITPDGTVTTIAGSTTVGHKDGIGTDAQFEPLYDVIVADNNTLLVSENYDIRRIDLTTGQVTLIAGSSQRGTIDGPALAARFSAPVQLTVANGNIYATESRRVIRQISPNP